MTPKAPIILGNPTLLSNGTPNFCVKLSSHSLHLPISTASAISTLDVAQAISINLDQGMLSINAEHMEPPANAVKSMTDNLTDRV